MFNLKQEIGTLVAIAVAYFATPAQSQQQLLGSSTFPLNTRDERQFSPTYRLPESWYAPPSGATTPLWQYLNPPARPTPVPRSIIDFGGGPSAPLVPRQRLPPGSQHQTIQGGAAGSTVLAAMEAVGKPRNAALLTTWPRATPEQERCDNALSSGKAIFSRWVASARPPSRVQFDTLDAWLRTSPAAGIATTEVKAAVTQAMNVCFSPRAPDGLQDNVTQRIGAIAGAAGERECSGLQLDATRVLTARHCLKVANALGGLREATSADLAAFRFELGEGASYAVQKIEARGPSGLLPDEWAVIRTAPMPPPTGALPLPSSPEEIEPGTPMLVAGLVTATDGGHFEPKFSQGDSCRAVYATNSCIVHTCNTMPGLSGAPLFARLSDRWVFVGVHVRAIEESDLKVARCRHPAAESVRTHLTNGGVYVPAAVR